MVLYLNKLESPPPKDALCQTWLKLVPCSDSGEENVLISSMYLPLEKDGALHLNKLKSPSPKDALCQIWLKLVH